MCIQILTCKAFNYKAHDEHDYFFKKWNKTSVAVNLRKVAHYKQGGCYLKYSFRNTV
jgi:hypothetical protein